MSAKFMDGEEKCYVQINPIKNQDRQLTISKPINTQNWLYAGMAIHRSKSEVLNSIEKTILFEVKHLKIIRLDDHINDYIDSSKRLDPYETFFHEQCIADIIERLKAIKDLLHDDLYVQITGKFQASINFCKTHNWKNIFNITENELFEAVHYQASINFMDEFLLRRINLIKDVLIKRLEKTNINIDPEEMERRKKSIRSDSEFSFNNFKKIADTIGLTNEFQKSCFNMSDLDDDIRVKIVDTMAQGIVLLEYIATSSEIKINNLEAIKSIYNRYAYYGELINLSISLNPLALPDDHDKARSVPTEKIPNLLIDFVENRKLQKSEFIAEKSDEKPRRGGACCNVS